MGRPNRVRNDRGVTDCYRDDTRYSSVPIEISGSSVIQIAIA